MKKSEFIQIEKEIKNELINAFNLYKDGKLSTLDFQDVLRNAVNKVPNYFINDEDELEELDSLSRAMFIEHTQELISNVENWSSCTANTTGTASFLNYFICEDVL